MSEEEYYGGDGFHCPVCQCDDIQGGEVDLGNGLIERYVVCHNCHYEWEVEVAAI
jgi:transcription elongation factor Elf1